MSFTGPGTLVIRPMNAKLTRDTETFGKMDPYCNVKIGANPQRTKEHKDAGKFPAWNDTLTFRRNDEQLMELEVWDKDTVSKSDLIAQATVALQQFFDKKNGTEWFPLNYKGKAAGQILIGYEWHPDGGEKKGEKGGKNAHGQGQGQGYQYNPPPQAGYYPPPQGQYPPPQASGYYPPPNQSYPPQGQYPPPQGQYPPPQGQYPPPQASGYYPPPNQSYPPQGQYPPPQGQYPPPNQSQPPQQGQYPPPNQSYPPQQGQYPPPQQGQYPPPQGQYPPPQGQYPPQQGQYPPPQGQYPSQQGQYPPQGYPQQYP